MKRMTVAMAAIAILISTGGCTRAGLAERVLTEQGYTNIEAGGYGWLSCSEDDAFKTNFEAIAPNGKRVTGTVCSGWFKGATIRFD